MQILQRSQSPCDSRSCRQPTFSNQFARTQEMLHIKFRLLRKASPRERAQQQQTETKAIQTGSTHKHLSSIRDQRVSNFLQWVLASEHPAAKCEMERQVILQYKQQ